MEMTRRGFIGAPLGLLAASGAEAAEAKRKTSGGLPALETIVLNRAAFGPAAGDAEAFRKLGRTGPQRLAAYVDAQLHPAHIDDKACEDRIKAAGFATLEKPLKALWSDHVIAANELRERMMAQVQTSTGAAKPPANSDEQKLRHQPVRETEAATWLRAVYSRRQLQEVLADFWHDHFNVFGWDQQIAPVFVHYDRDVIRPHLFGNFREMLGATAKSPAMLFYLDNAVSQSGNPNENYARELFELHTLGAENYLGTQDREEVPGYDRGAPAGYVDGDVYEAARAFTGWRVDGGKNTGDTGEFLYFEPWHDRFQKIVLGRSLREYQPPMRDGEDVLDLVAAHPGTARYVCRKLCRRLVSDDPPEALIAAAAKVFLDHSETPDQLRRVVRTILLSEAFRATWGGKMKRPFEAVVGMLRAMNADFYPSEPFLNYYQRAGQRLFQWRTPDGYPDDHTRWGGTTPTLERWRGANLLMTNAWDKVRTDPEKLTPETARTPLELARHWSAKLLGGAAPAAHVQAVADFLAGGRNTDSPLPEPQRRERLAGAVALLLMSPEYQLK